MKPYNEIFINNIHNRLVYSFFIDDRIKSFNDHISYKVHLECLKAIFEMYPFFHEVIFVITANDITNKLINELKYKLSNICINVINLEFIIEQNDAYSREGNVFKKYILDKLDDYDGITLFFHNKGLDSKYDNDFPYYWIIGQYYFNIIHLMYFQYDSFIKSKKLLYGWPYINDNYYKQWFYAGSCYWMKTQELKKYLDSHYIDHEDKITLKTVAEYYFPTRVELDYVDYPLSNIIKEKCELLFNHNFSDESMNEYMKYVLSYNEYINFNDFFKNIMNKINEV